jgi:hypothetical protein
MQTDSIQSINVNIEKFRIEKSEVRSQNTIFHLHYELNCHVKLIVEL